MPTSWQFTIDFDFYMQKVAATPQVQCLVRKISYVITQACHDIYFVRPLSNWAIDLILMDKVCPQRIIEGWAFPLWRGGKGDIINVAKNVGSDIKLGFSCKEKKEAKYQVYRGWNSTRLGWSFLYGWQYNVTNLKLPLIGFDFLRIFDKDTIIYV